jgi:hypothetical protein
LVLIIKQFFKESLMKKFILAFTIITLALLVSSEARSAEKGNHGKAHHIEQQEDGGHHAGEGEAELRLSPDVKNILIREMRYLSSAMKELAPALINGDWQQTATIATKMRDSYIMKQELTSEQMEELHHALPPLFAEYDQAFHEYAGMLAHAAENKNADVANFYLFKLSEACIKCHSRYATERFPGFVNESHSH